MKEHRQSDLLNELLSLPSAFDPQYHQLPGLALCLPGLGATPVKTDGHLAAGRVRPVGGGHPCLSRETAMLHDCD